MSHFQITPSKVKGVISVPTSKSHTMRAILFASLADGTSFVRRFLPSPDTNHMIDACRLLGAKVNVLDDVLEITGVAGSIPIIEDVIQAGNSGIILRFLTAVAALSPSYAIITGDHSLRHQRPMQAMLQALQEMGVSAVSSRGDGHAPLIVKGPLKGGKITISGEDSQPVSSLLIACAMAEGPTEIRVKNPGEKPWVNLTLSWLDRLGVRYTNENFERFTLEGRARFSAFDYTVPGDWSTAAFPLAAALVTQSSLTIENVSMDDPQGDKEIIYVLRKMGALLDIDTKAVHVKSGSRLKGMTIDVNPFIDALPILAVIACFAEGETRLVNGAVARHKECDRLRCMAQELKKMGALIEEKNDALIIQGGSLRGSPLDSHGDHRMALSLAVAALGGQGPSTIHNVACIAKTYPDFIKSFRSIGVKII
jgi:3-phosphoshikimate 1-carboxyvinyltransferase